MKEKKSEAPRRGNEELFKWDGNPTFGQILPLAAQHVLAAVVGCVTPAIIVAGVAGLSEQDSVILIQAALTMSAITTLIQVFPLLRTGKIAIGSGLPVIMGISFAYVPTMQAIAGRFDIATILGAQIVGGIVAVFVGIFIKQIRKFYPPLITGTVVFAIGLSLYPTAINYIRRAEFRKNEENAKTIYMASESVLTWYRSSGQWDEFREEVLDKGIKNTSFAGEMKDRIYAVTLAPGAYGTAEGDKSPVLDLMDNLTYSKDMLSQGAVAIEIDVESGHVYSAFYGTHCNGLDYGTGDVGGILDMEDRSYESRRDRFLGYYSADDITNA